MKKCFSSILLGLCMLLSSVLAFGQSKAVKGKVTAAEDGTGLPGVNVTVKGSTTGTVTDVNGAYSLTVPDNDAVLVFSFIGFKTQDAPVGNRSTINVALASDAQTLQEVVVTGYTTENRREVTGAVSTVKARELVAVPSGNVEQQLQGRVPGLTVITNGQPGTTSVVRLRGFGAFGGNEPLYVVDGVPVQGTNFLQPDDIESTTVLKDAPSASIYGARAANGVIVITTKKGKTGPGKLNINYDGVMGITVPGKVNNILMPQESADWTWAALRNTARQLDTLPEFKHDQFGTKDKPVLPDYLIVGDQFGVVGNVDLNAEREKYNVDATKGGIYQVVRANKAGTNWWDEITRIAPVSRHLLSFAGGGENSTFYVSLGAQDQAGILLHQNFKRYSFRANSEFNITKNLRIGENLQATYLSARGLIGGNGGRGAANEENDILQAFRMHPIIPVYDEFGGYAGTAAKGFNNPRNPVANRDRGVNNLNYAGLFFGNVYAELDVLKGLTLRSSIGGGYNTNYFNNHAPRQYENSENSGSFQYAEGSGYGSNWVFTNTAKYNVKFGVHGLDLLAGIEALNTGRGRNISGTGLNPFITDPNYVNLRTTSSTGRTVTSDFFNGANFFSLFGRAQYNFNDKYLITGVVRRDGASVFGSANRYGIFPAVSAAWRISTENFMQGIAFINDLKIRGGWGEMGNSNNVDPYNQFTLFSSSIPVAAYDLTGANTSALEGIYRSRLGNPLAKWETSTTANIGIDAILFNNKLELEVDFWRKNTRDLLFSLETASVVGPLANDPSVNIGDMRNQGIDLKIINRGNFDVDFGYELTFSGTFLKNEIVSVAPSVNAFPAGGSRIGNLINNQVGRPISSYYGYKVIGLFQSPEDVQNSPEQSGAAPGRFKYADINDDKKITAEDRTYLGDPVPNFSGGINLKLNFKNFELETFLFAALGFQNYNFSKWFTDFYPSFTGAAIGTNVRDSWTFEKGGNTVPIFENVSNMSTNAASNSYYVENGDYVRMGNLQIGYKLPTPFLSRFGIQKAKVYLQGTNLFTISNYSGLDPGVGGAADTTLGIDVGNPPVTRGFNLGVNLGF